MPDPAFHVHVRLGWHPEHPNAVTAATVGTDTYAARALLSVHGFRPTDDQTMILARIDREEPYYADQAAHALRKAGVTVEITPNLQEDIDSEWTWLDHPMHWLNRDEIREVSAEAQKVYDDIASGRLVIHAHAHDGWTHVAVGTYPGGESIHLHGEDHLRQVALVYDTPTQAIAEFQKLYGEAVRPGPVPATETEQQAAKALATTGTTAPSSTASGAQRKPARPAPEIVPVYAAEAGDHEVLLHDFLATQADWEKVRARGENATIASHESLTLRALFDHEADGRDIKWAFAAYETPVSDLLWHGKATASTPSQIVRTLLTFMASENAWGRGPCTSVTETAIAEAARPLANAGWKYAVDDRYLTWQAPGTHAAGVQFDAFAAQQTNSPLPTWTVWGGHAAHQPDWEIHLSANAPAALVKDLTAHMVLGHGLRSPSRPTHPALPLASRLGPPIPSPSHGIRAR
ncbi:MULTISPECIES: DUF317 domain-containing protein [Streptomyces]|uniref:DUF317 domain-containing protein n=1 Tax=Streptomyces TaxID=1883 RepID=UPI00163BDED6|nr:MULTISPECIES: DUF317 domain-containing protein [Streptomyces]MBC2878046.1 DUF317 domain-containing protein [Streptomyces sp. TYQ1024]UBI40000.1 DUF317 domain-containing protein [Streptomyces mobaraensis]UKW32581.1 DUF317 domain-containing protein [Streptomyces sp. TYQ1024]